MLISSGRVLAAIVISMPVAVPAGLGFGQIRRLNRFFSPLIYIVYPVPKIVFLPVILILFGSGDASKVLLVGLILFFQMLVVVRDQAAHLRPELIASVRSMGAGRRALFRFVYLPACRPGRDYRPARQRRHRDCRVVHRGDLCDEFRPGVLYRRRELGGTALR